MLLHEATQSILTVGKFRSLQSSSKQASTILWHLELCNQEEATVRSNFVVESAHRIYHDAHAVCSGDELVLESRVASKETMCLNMSEECKLQGPGIARSLLDSTAVIGCHEMFAKVLQPGSPKDKFRAVLFQNETLSAQSRAPILRAQDTVCFYHKSLDSFLSFDPHNIDTTKARLPTEEAEMAIHFYRSKRSSSNARKKCAWLWQIESVAFCGAGNAVEADSGEYRIKHLTSGCYLKQDLASGKTTHTLDSNDPGTLFHFEHWHAARRGLGESTAFSQEILLTDLVFIRSVHGEYLCGADTSSAAAKQRQTRAHFLPGRESQPGQHPLAIIAVKRGSLHSVLELRRHVNLLSCFLHCLQELPTVAALPRTESESYQLVQKLLSTVDEWYRSLFATLEFLILNCTVGEGTDLRTKRGKLNREVQKDLRELGCIPLLFSLIQTLMSKGASHVLNSKGTGQSRYCHLMFASCQELSEIFNLEVLIFHLCRHVVRGNDRNSAILFWFLTHDEELSFQRLLGCGVGATGCIVEILQTRHDLLTEDIANGLIRKVKDIIEVKKDHGCIGMLVAMCLCEGEAKPKIQESICTTILQDSANHLPLCRWDDAENTLLVHVPEDTWMEALEGVSREPSCISVSDREYLDVVQFNDEESCEEAGTRGRFRYFASCTELYHALAHGRNQLALSCLVQGRNHFVLAFEDVFNVMKTQELPALIRAHYTKLMMRLWVDRDPMIHTPRIRLTRAWNSLDGQGASSPVRNHPHSRALASVQLHQDACVRRTHTRTSHAHPHFFSLLPSFSFALSHSLSNLHRQTSQTSGGLVASAACKAGQHHRFRWLPVKTMQQWRTL